MAVQDEDTKNKRASDPDVSVADDTEKGGEDLRGDSIEPTGEHATPTNLGSAKYVHAAFFAAGILTAYLSGKVLLTIWNNLAEWPVAVRLVPQLLNYAEDQRETLTMIAGAVIGLLAVIQTYRKENIRRGADEVAAELSKVTWPNKETVSNGTVVVIVASAVATVYIALLDRFWGFVTTLIYGV